MEATEDAWSQRQLMHTLHHPIHFVVCSVWGLAHNFYTSKVWYICLRVLLYFAEEKYAKQFSWSVMETCFQRWKIGSITRLPSVFIFCFTPQARCGLSYPGLHSPLVQLACQSFCRCCAYISCHLSALGRLSMNTGGSSGTHRGDVLGLRTSLPCK